MEYISTLAQPAYVFPLLIVLLSAFVQAVTGTGLVILAAPMLMLFFGAKETVLITLIIATVSNTGQAYFVYKDANLHIVRYMIVGSFFGLPLGLLLYYGFSNAMLKITISVVVILFLVISYFLKIQFQETSRNSLLTGAFSGIFYTTTGMGGMPLILYTTHMPMTPSMMRGTAIIYFFFGNVFSLIAFYVSGANFSYALHMTLYLLPGLLIGVLLGHAMFRFIPVNVFRHMVFALLYIACFYAAYGAIMG